MLKRLALVIFLLSIELLMVRLGFWQLAREQQKMQQQQALARALAEKTPSTLASALRSNNRYTWVVDDFNFSDKTLYLLDNQRRGSAVGLSVFQRAEASNKQTILLELGWVAIPGNRQIPPLTGLIGKLRVQGLFMPPPSAGIALGQNMQQLSNGNWLLTHVDIAQLNIKNKAQLSSRILRMDPNLRVGYQRDLNIQINSLPPEKHRAYAVQWFSMAAVFAVLCFYLGLRKKHARIT